MLNSPVGAPFIVFKLTMMRYSRFPPNKPHEQAVVCMTSMGDIHVALRHTLEAEEDLKKASALVESLATPHPGQCTWEIPLLSGNPEGANLLGSTVERHEKLSGDFTKPFHYCLWMRSIFWDIRPFSFSKIIWKLRSASVRCWFPNSAQ